MGIAWEAQPGYMFTLVLDISFCFFFFFFFLGGGGFGFPRQKMAASCYG